MPTSISEAGATPSPSRSPREAGARLLGEFRRRAHAEGFHDVKIGRANARPEAGERLQAFIHAGRHGDMDWMAETAARRASPSAMWPEARTAIVLAMSYAPDLDPMQRLQNRKAGTISVYALGRDYHD